MDVEDLYGELIAFPPTMEINNYGKIADLLHTTGILENPPKSQYQPIDY
jgi:hypothetical protein